MIERDKSKNRDNENRQKRQKRYYQDIRIYAQQHTNAEASEKDRIQANQGSTSDAKTIRMVIRKQQRKGWIRSSQKQSRIRKWKVLTLIKEVMKTSKQTN